MRKLFWLAAGVLMAQPAAAQTAGSGINAGTGLPTHIVAPPAENLVPRTAGNIVQPQAENLVPRNAGNIVAQPVENLVPGVGGSADAGSLATGTALGTVPETSTATGVGSVSGMTLPPAVVSETVIPLTPSSFTGGGRLISPDTVGRFEGLAGGTVFAPTGTGPGSIPGGPNYVGARIEPFDPDEPDALDFSRSP